MRSNLFAGNTDTSALRSEIANLTRKIENHSTTQHSFAFQNFLWITPVIAAVLLIFVDFLFATYGSSPLLSADKIIYANIAIPVSIIVAVAGITTSRKRYYYSHDGAAIDSYKAKRAQKVLDYIQAQYKLPIDASQQKYVVSSSKGPGKYLSFYFYGGLTNNIDSNTNQYRFEIVGKDLVLSINAGTYGKTTRYDIVDVQSL